MSAHASQAFSIAHCTDSEDLPSIYLLNVVKKQEILIKTQKTKQVMFYREGDLIGLQTPKHRLDFGKLQLL